MFNQNLPSLGHIFAIPCCGLFVPFVCHSELWLANLHFVARQPLQVNWAERRFQGLVSIALRPAPFTLYTKQGSPRPEARLLWVHILFLMFRTGRYTAAVHISRSRGVCVAFIGKAYGRKSFCISVRPQGGCACAGCCRDLVI